MTFTMKKTETKRGFALWLDGAAWLILLLMSLGVVWTSAGAGARALSAQTALDSRIAMARWGAERVYSSCPGDDVNGIASCANGIAKPGVLSPAAPSSGAITNALPLEKMRVDWKLYSLDATPSTSGACVNRYVAQTNPAMVWALVACASTA